MRDSGLLREFQISNDRVPSRDNYEKRPVLSATIHPDLKRNLVAMSERKGLSISQVKDEVLYTGLVQPSYPSMSGKPTNLLGHLLEKYQYVEPRHDLIAEALWLLADPKGYRSKIQSQGSNKANET